MRRATSGGAARTPPTPRTTQLPRLHHLRGLRVLAQPRRQHDASQRHLPQRPRAVPDLRLRAADAAGAVARAEAPCLDAGTGCDVLAIPHNSNESNGTMFFVEYPGAQTIDEERAQAAFRAAMEPLVEIYQHKGDSECMNGLSGIVGAPDELCDVREAPAGRRSPDCGDGIGQLRRRRLAAACRASTTCAASLLAGLQEEERLGVNPYRLGFIGSTDTHNGTPGVTGRVDVHRPSRHQRRHARRSSSDTGAGRRRHHLQSGRTRRRCGPRRTRAPASSTRCAGARRFATSGTRISVRVFGGWDLPGESVRRPACWSQAATSAACRWAAILPHRRPAAPRPTFVDLRAARSGHGGAPRHAAAAPAGHQGLDRERRGAPAGATTWPATPTTAPASTSATCDAARARRRLAVHGVDRSRLRSRSSAPSTTCASWRTRRAAGAPAMCNRLPPASGPPSCTDPERAEDDPGARLDLADLVRAGT